MTRQGAAILDSTAPPESATSDVHEPRSARRRWRARLGVGIGVALALIAAVVITTRSSGPHAPTAEQVNATVHAAIDKAAADAAKAPARSTQVYQAILPSMVVIVTERASAGGASSDGDNGLGSGVIVNAQGAILTARHVVAGARSIEVTFADGTKAAATIASEQPENDIAVLRADGAPAVLVPAVLGGSRSLRVGDEAYAVGHPLGLTESLSAGVISGLERTIPIPDGTTLHGLIQFDTAVNPGNSGGPLLNRDGQVIGIVTGLANPSHQGFFSGIGFAVPIGAAGGAAGAPPQ